MTRILFEADDYGITTGTADGILKGIREGVIRNTGLFANMPSAAYAVSHMKEHPEVCFGIDFNLVAGYPVSDPKEVPSLVNEEGHFITSHERLKAGKIIGGNSINVEFETDPYDYEETYLECMNQVKRFEELSGMLPGYLHGHSLLTGNIVKVIRRISKELNIPFSMDTIQEKGLFSIPCTWTPKPFPIEAQLTTDVEEELLKVLPLALEHENCCFICHAGFVDQDLLEETSYTIIRVKDLRAMTSPKIKAFLEEHHVELITYRDLKGM